MAKKIFRQIIFYASLLIAWQALILLKLFPSYIFPSPAAVFETLCSGFSDKTFLIAIGVSLKRIFLGYSLALIIGTSVGIIICKNEFVSETLGSLILGLQTLPSICWFPLAILWFGLNEKAILFIVVMGAVFSITISTETAIRNIPPLYMKVGKNFGAKRFILFREVIVPAALPHFLNGLKQGWSFAWRSLMAAEILFVSLGLGYLLTVGRELNDMSQVIAVIGVIAFISILFDKILFGKIQANIRKKWGLINNA